MGYEYIKIIQIEALSYKICDYNICKFPKWLHKNNMLISASQKLATYRCKLMTKYIILK